MIKQLIAIILLSILLIFSMVYAQQGLQFLVSAHQWVSDMLTEVFSGGQAGNLLRNLLSLLAIPFIVGLVPVLIYWITKRKWFPYFMELLWVTWLLQTAVVVMQYAPASA